MTRVRLYAHPVAGAEQVFEAESIGGWLLTHFGDRPQVGVRVFAGEPSEESEVTGNVPALLRNDAAEYVVLQNPGSDPATWLTIISLVFSVATALLATTPQMPANINRTQQSPNNSLGSRENQVRILQRIEDIFGTVQAIPSLMMPTYNKYINNRKYEYGYYCVSRGYCDLAEISDGDTLISAIEGASAAVYWPFTSPNSGDAPVVQIGSPIIDKVLTVARSNSVDGITLKPLNELELARGATYSFEPTAGGDIIRQLWPDSSGPKGANFNSIVNPGDDITVAMPDYSETFTLSVTGSTSLAGFTGAFTYDSIGSTGGGDGAGSGAGGGSGGGG